jgi:uncharacterized protein
MDIKNFKKKAAKHKASLTAFLQKLDEIVPEDMPVLVAETDKQVWETIDCTTCANCCKTMTPTYKRSDVIRMSKHLGMKPKDFVEKWLRKEEDSGDWVNQSVPCQFLGADDRCTVYEVRPIDCKEFPHHNKKPFDLYNDTFIQNLHRCPATFTLVQQLKKRIEKEYEW